MDRCLGHPAPPVEGEPPGAGKARGTAVADRVHVRGGTPAPGTGAPGQGAPLLSGRHQERPDLPPRIHRHRRDSRPRGQD